VWCRSRGGFVEGQRVVSDEAEIWGLTGTADPIAPADVNCLPSFSIQYLIKAAWLIIR
jgi:hypothetical protein